MYKKLLIEAGGGIISRSQQSEQAEAATIAIGLGGTGISCLRELKKEVYNKLKPDNGEESVVPEYKHIKFLAVDTDKDSLGANGDLDAIDSNTEFFDISCNDINGLLTSIQELKGSHPELGWLCTGDVTKGKKGLSIYSAEAGAGGVRQIGRLLLIQKSSNFVRKITNIIKTAVTDLPAGSPINIHIFTGMGGGTGAGTFLDVCYLIQYVLQEENFIGRTETCGYFFLPDVNIANYVNEETEKYVKVNGFASMKELDYCMNFHRNGGDWNPSLK